jgi:hypothetical protein
MAKNDWILPVVLLAGGYIWYTRFGGEAVINDLLGGLKGGGSDFSFSGGGAKVDVNLPPSAEGISNNVKSMLQKMGVNMNESGQNISRTRQVDTTGQAKQTQTKSQRSDVFFTIPRFGNL